MPATFGLNGEGPTNSSGAVASAPFRKARREKDLAATLFNLPPLFPFCLVCSLSFMKTSPMDFVRRQDPFIRQVFNEA